jgi:hypothetical protein
LAKSISARTAGRSCRPPPRRPAALDIRQQALQGRPLQRAAGHAAIVVAVGHQHPALGALAGDVGLAGLALGVEAVELHVEPLLARLAGVGTRSAELLHRAGMVASARVDLRLMPADLRWFLRPKKVQPFQRVPVMCRATEESDW